MRDILRLWLGCSLALWGMLLVAGEFYSFAAVLLPAGAAYCYYYGKRKERKMAECASCPEYGTGKICSGYALQAELAREYEEKATNYLLATGYVPPSISNR